MFAWGGYRERLPRVLLDGRRRSIQQDVILRRTSLIALRKEEILRELGRILLGACGG